MRARVLVAVLIGAVAGCAAVIDLGDEATLRPTTDASTPLVEASTADASAPPICGLPDSTNADCAACIQQQCCDVSKACAASAECMAGLQCIKDCLVQVSCISRCTMQYPAIASETTCSAFKCSKCTPGPECSRLGACVYGLPDAALLRSVEEGRILDLNEDACNAARQQVTVNDSDAAACFGN